MWCPIETNHYLPSVVFNIFLLSLLIFIIFRSFDAIIAILFVFANPANLPKPESNSARERYKQSYGSGQTSFASMIFEVCDQEANNKWDQSIKNDTFDSQILRGRGIKTKTTAGGCSWMFMINRLSGNYLGKNQISHYGVGPNSHDLRKQRC